MRDNPSLQDLLEAQKHFDLPSPVLVEKDWYVVRALSAINAADVKPCRRGEVYVGASDREIL